MTMREEIARAVRSEIQRVCDMAGDRYGIAISVSVNADSRFVTAILDAMREPTEKMLKAAFDAEREAAGKHYACARTMHTAVWQAMIDATRTEEGEHHG